MPSRISIVKILKYTEQLCFTIHNCFTDCLQARIEKNEREREQTEKSEKVEERQLEQNHLVFCTNHQVDVVGGQCLLQTAPLSVHSGLCTNPKNAAT